jgi:creatinine amidohydrolase
LAETFEITQMNWMEVELRLQSDCRMVLPLGATEQHGYLSLLTDTLFAQYVAHAACQRVNVLLGPELPFGCSAFAVNFPGTMSLQTATLCHVIRDIVDCAYRQGFRRLIFVSGHGGNGVVSGVLEELQLDRPGLVLYYRDAWAGMKNRVQNIEEEQHLPKTEHAAWNEAFSFARVSNIPDLEKTLPRSADFPEYPLNPRTARHFLGDGIVSGKYVIEDEETMSELLRLCVDDLASFLESIPQDASLE